LFTLFLVNPSLVHQRKVADSLRIEKNARSQKRKEKLERIRQARENMEEELKRLKSLKKLQIVEKIRKIQAVAGKSLIEVARFDRLIETGEFDEKQFDREMEAEFGEEYYEQSDEQEAELRRFLKL